MPNDVQPKVKLIPKNKFIILYSNRERRVETIIVPETKSYESHKSWRYGDCTVHSVGEGVEIDIRPGDKVILDPLTPVKQFEDITKHIEEIEGKKLKQDETAGRLEGYFACEEKHIIAIIR